MEYYERQADTNQRLGFDMYGEWLIFGDTQGKLMLQSISDKSKRAEVTIGDRIINCVSIEAQTGIAAITDGERCFKIKTPARANFCEGKESPASSDERLFGLENLSGLETSRIGHLNIPVLLKTVFNEPEITL